MTILVTGGCGFIGSNFIRYYLETHDDLVINLDSLTYAGNRSNLDGVPKKNYQFIQGDINNKVLVNDIIHHSKPDVIFNFAAESHVDNSIKDSSPFIQTNVLGTVNLLECVRQHKSIRFVHISTDEVYGSLREHDPRFNTITPYAPRSPYSASKAASDHFVMAYHHTHGLDTVITNCSNNYGPHQHPEKLIPTVIRKALAGEKIPVYGDGSNIRDWIFVKDHCEGILKAAELGKSGHQYLFGGNNQVHNIDLVEKILDLLNLNYDLISFVEDRKGHDYRYDIDSSKAEVHLGWLPRTELENGLQFTVDWYKNNMEWVNKCLKRSALY